VIPFRYLFIELLTGALSLLTLLRFGPSMTGLLAFAFICLCIVIAFIDLDYMIIPDVITYPATFAGIAIGAINWYGTVPFLGYPFVASPWESAYGLLMGPGLLLAVWWLYLKIRKREGLGLGDVKFLAVVGATFGMEGAWFTIFFGSIVGSLTAIVALVTRRGSFGSYFPFGPYLVMAAIAYLFDVHLLIGHTFSPTMPRTWWIATQL
jgi:leader peptidase (prepilin peptidase)/N-methyltransferase